MEILAGASKVKIGNNNISSVGRDQYNYNYYPTQTRGKKRKDDRSLPELSEFTEIKQGDIYKAKDGVCYSWRLCSNGKDDTEAAVYHAELNVTGSFGQKKFTVKTYRGRNAMKEWRRDFSQCSNDWLRDIPLFGYSKSSVPSLIFSGELVPVALMEARMGDVGLFYIELLRHSLGCSRNELWMDPMQGRFCRGPIGPECRFWPEGHFDVIVPSDVEFLKEDVVIRYFASKEDDQGLLSTLGYSFRVERLNDIPATSHNHVISSLTNSTIAFYQNVRWWSWTDCLGTRQVMRDGATRFRLRDDRRKIDLDSVNESEFWLAQASSVFDAHNISYDEDLSTYKLVYPYLELTGTIQKCKRKRQRRQQLHIPIYFIILPLSNPVYHWSFDPTGQTPLSPGMCKYLGLPFKLSLKVTPCQLSWPTKVYKAVRDYQIAKGFDPKTTDFAQSLRYPIFDVVLAENRFEEIIEEQHEMELVESGNPPLPTVRDDLGPDSNGNDWDQHVYRLDESPEEWDDSLSLDLLFYETEGLTNMTSSLDDVGSARSDTANPMYNQQSTMRSILGAIFAPLTWEAIEGSNISAAAI